MSRTEGARGRPPRGGAGGGRARPGRDEGEGRVRPEVKDRAQELTKQGMPFQMAMAVAQGRLELNEALERLARRAEVDSLMRKYEINRALATQIAMGHADLEAFLARRRMDEHRAAHRERSILEIARDQGTVLTLGLHGGRQVTGVIRETDAYHATVQPKAGEPEVVHKLQIKFVYPADDWKRVKKIQRKDKELSAAPRGPIERPQDRYTISDKRLFRYMDAGAAIDVTLLEGEIFRGTVAWFGRYEFGLEIKGGEVTVFRHALQHVATA